MRAPLTSLLSPLLAALALASCTQVQVGSHLLKNQINAKGCAPEGINKVGNPYLVDGIRYTPIKSSYAYSERGIASWYGSDFHGKPTANGECYNMYAYTAAHKTLPLPTVVRVTNLENNKSIVVKVNDRGPFVRGRIIDLSYAAAQSLGMVGGGTAPVLVEAVSGPHHSPGGASRFASSAPAAPARGQGPTLVGSYVPATVESEALDDTPLQPSRQTAAPLLKEEQILPGTELAMAESRANTPPPAKALPTPPDKSDVPNRNFKPLKHTQAFVQIGAYSNHAAALSQKEKLQIIDKNAFIEPIQRNGATLHRVRIGPYASTGDAENMLNVALESGFPAASIVIEQE